MLDQMIFVGFNSKVAALDRTSGQVLWHWRSPRGSGYTTVMLDGDRLIVSVMGYTYCLDPLTGQQQWANELPGMGMGVATLTSVRGMAANAEGAAAAEEENNSAAAMPPAVT
jgi:outer membrane protein assembly factor BamB